MKNKKGLPLREHDRWIRVFGAREHNLKNSDVAIPKNTLTVITGPSGSGKSSLAMDVLYAEGKRRYMESLSSYARQFLGIAKKPEVDHINGLCPAIAIEQKTVSANPRSTVGTITEIYDYMRVLFARIGRVHCPECHCEIKAESPEQIAEMICHSFAGKTITIAAPIAVERKGEFKQELLRLFHKGFYRFRIDNVLRTIQSENGIKKLALHKTQKHTIDMLIDSITVHEEEKTRLIEAICRSFEYAHETCRIIVGKSDYVYSSQRVCLQCAQSIPELEPRYFSFNSPVGACQRCHGLGILHTWPWKKGDADAWKAKYPDFFGKYAQKRTCPTCLGKRLHKVALAVTVGGKNIYDVSDLSIKDTLHFFEQLSLTEIEQTIAEALLQEIISRLTFLDNVGLSYLSLNRSARTLSGGEGQRIRLAKQIGSALSGVLYVLDEPSIGLHQRDNNRLIATLKMLRDQGNTVLVVEHDLEMVQQADYVIDMGPAAGIQGGNVTAFGLPKECANNKNSLTGAFLSGKRSIKLPEKRRVSKRFLTLQKASSNNLKNISVRFPLNVFCGISGVSGSGKSTLIMQELVPILQQAYAPSRRRVVKNDKIKGIDQLANIVVIDQAPIGRTPRSNPATYLGIFDEIRSLFARLPESNARGYKAGRFSFNVPGGRCFECNGEGVRKITMHFLPEVTVMCDACHGTRFNAETLAITYKGKNIADILAMTAPEAMEFFASHLHIVKRLKLLCDVGLDYIKLGQPSTTLSGGEAQRVKLVNELAKRGTQTMYILDEPTTGLHNSDIERLLHVLNTLVDKGNSVIVIEHNLDLLKTVDYLIDLGPEGGDDGGEIVACGTPEEVARCKKSYTGMYLKKLLRKS